MTRGQQSLTDLGKCFPGRRQSKCQGPKMGTSLAYSMDSMPLWLELGEGAENGGK